MALNEFPCVALQGNEGESFYFVNYATGSTLIKDKEIENPIKYPGTMLFRTDLYDYFASLDKQKVLDYITEHGLHE